MQKMRLTRYELELMDVIWRLGEGTVQDVCDNLDRELAYTTVMTTLRLLHSKKKVLKRVKRGRAHVYRPVVTREEVSRSVLTDLQDVLFRDRLPTLVLGMLEEGEFSPQDIEAIKAASEESQKTGDTTVSPSMFLETIGSLTVQITLMIGIVAWITCRRQAAAAADWTWTALHACILLVTGAAFLLPHLRPVTWAGICVTAESAWIQQAIDLGGEFLFWLWAGGVGVMLLALAAGMWRANVPGPRFAARPAFDADAIWNRRPLELGLPLSPIDVRVSNISVSPFCWQLHRPTIVVPDLLLDFPIDEQRAVLNHELVHLSAQHPLCLFLQRIVESIFWFHPLVWWSSRQAAAAREFRCDAQAVESRQEVAVYLQSLLRLIEARIPSPTALPAGLGFLGDTSLLSRRADVLAETLGKRIVRIRKVPTLATLVVVSTACVATWLPLNPHASRRSAGRLGRSGRPGFSMRPESKFATTKSTDIAWRPTSRKRGNRVNSPTSFATRDSLSRADRPRTRRPSCSRRAARIRRRPDCRGRPRRGRRTSAGWCRFRRTAPKAAWLTDRKQARGRRRGEDLRLRCQRTIDAFDLHLLKPGDRGLDRPLDRRSLGWSMSMRYSTMPTLSRTAERRQLVRPCAARTEVDLVVLRHQTVG